MAALNITLFGAPRIERDGAAVTVERRKSLALLAYLAVTRQPHGRDVAGHAALARCGCRTRSRRVAPHARGSQRQPRQRLGGCRGGSDRAARADAGLQVDIEHFHTALAQVAGHSHPPHRLCDACLVPPG